MTTSRRDTLRALSALVGTLAVAPETIWARAKSPATRPDRLLVRLCDLVIPKTDTPGAVAAGVPAFATVAIAAGLRGASPENFAAFSRALHARAGGSFIRLRTSRAHALLAEVDSTAYSAPVPNNTNAADDAVKHWRAIKSVIVLGYYTSEIGGSQELRYELVPGVFEPDVPLATEPRAYSSDWTGVKFG